jgi:molybdate transport system substrate-binding protein
MDTVTNEHLASGSPQVFASNTLEIMAAAGNPKHIKSVADLANPDVKVAVCATDVPCGAYTQEVFKKAGVTVHPVSQETSVSSVVTKVTLGEVDAGVVYTTDVKAAGDKAAGVPIPASQNVTAEYPIARLKDAPNGDGATAFVDYVLGPAGQQVLASYGFSPAGK